MTIYKGILELINISIVATTVFILIVVFTRLIGLRSFAKMTSIDFATTIAIGSMIASVILPSKSSIIGGCFGIFMVYLLQLSSSWLKTRSKLFSKIVENSPTIIMKDGNISHKALKKVNMSEADLIAKLREANVLDPKRVKAVVFESTGDVSVLHGDDDEKLSDFLLSDLN